MYLDKYVALLISRGVRSPRDVAVILNVSERDVEEKLCEMEQKGLVKCSRHGFWLFKKVICKLSSKGFELAEEAWKELLETRKRLEKELINTTSDEERKQVIQQLVAQEPLLIHVMPLMLWLNIIPLTLFPMLLLNEILLHRHIIEDDTYLM
jgi:DNA-binding MarR family transcriptional regulator